MAKKSKVELVAEGKLLTALVSAARKKTHNFALLLGSDGAYLEADPRKKASLLHKDAKKAGGGAKGAVGEMVVDGREITLTCDEGEEPPSNMGRLLKKHLAERGLAVKVIVLAHDGKVLESGEDKAEAPKPGAPEQPAADGIEAKLRKAYDKTKPALITALTKGPKEHGDTLRKLVKAFETAMAGPDYDLALKVLTRLRTELARSASGERLTTALSGKDDPAKLAGMADLLDACLERGSKEDDFEAAAKPQLREMRTALKKALKATPPPDKLAELQAMKKKLDDAFLEYLAEQGHGPQRHEGKVTTQQLTDRAVDGKDPMTGTKFQPNGKEHKPTRHASRFLDPGDYVDAEEKIRATADFTVAKDDSVLRKDKRFSVELSLEDVMGSGFASKLEGVSRIGSVKNPKGSQPTDFTDGVMIAVYDRQADGAGVLVTMYPKPS